MGADNNCLLLRAFRWGYLWQSDDRLCGRWVTRRGGGSFWKAFRSFVAQLFIYLDCKRKCSLERCRMMMMTMTVIIIIIIIIIIIMHYLMFIWRRARSNEQNVHRKRMSLFRYKILFYLFIFMIISFLCYQWLYFKYACVKPLNHIERSSWQTKILEFGKGR
jgi:magnesium-transporting ATPase (P-type)